MILLSGCGYHVVSSKDFHRIKNLTLNYDQSTNHLANQLKVKLFAYGVNVFANDKKDCVLTIKNAQFKVNHNVDLRSFTANEVTYVYQVSLSLMKNKKFVFQDVKLTVSSKNILSSGDLIDVSDNNRLAKDDLEQMMLAKISDYILVNVDRIN